MYTYINSFGGWGYIRRWGMGWEFENEMPN
nr:MAG TPA: hypothetical protein [Caudoviricetes sp.]